MKRKVTVLLLAIMMVFAYLPSFAFADTSDESAGAGSNEASEQVQDIEDLKCEGDVDPSLRIFRKGKLLASTLASTTEENAAAHTKMREIIDTYADPDYYLRNSMDHNLTSEEVIEATAVATEATAGCKTDYEKIQAIYELIAENIYYDYDCYYNRKPTTNYGYSAWTTKVTICGGFAEICKAFLNCLNIPCMCVYGDDHAYNAAYDSQNERWIYFDATWGSKNKYEYGEKKYNGHNNNYWDMSVDFISRLKSHEVWSPIFLKQVENGGNVHYFLQATDYPWTDTSLWKVEVQKPLDKNAEEITIGLTDVLGCKTWIGGGAFCDCTKLKSISIPEGVERIETSAFYGCSSLTDITIPESVGYIGSYAFNGCSRITNIAVPDGVSVIGDFTFNKCSGLTSVAIPDSVTEIGDGAFKECVNLKNFDMPSGVSYVGKSAFQECNALTGIDIPEGIEEIKGYSFFFCKNLRKAYIPDSVTLIGEHAFTGCTNLCIYCSKDSYAHKYAVENEINYKLLPSIGNCTISLAKSKYHTTGEPVKPELIIRDDSKVLTEGVNYTVSKSDAAAGDVTVTVKGKGDYSDETTFSFTIEDHQWNDSYTVDVEPSCTVDGEESLYCSVCGEKKDTRAVEATGHSFGEWTDVDTGDCENPDLKERVCGDCGFTEVEGLIEDVHEWEDEATADEEASCVTDGTKSVHCENCGAKKDVTVIPASGQHNLVSNEGKAATCTEPGYVAYEECEDCGYTTYRVIPAMGHCWTFVENAAGLLKNGSRYEMCTVCGEKKNVEKIAGYATYYVKSLKVAKGRKSFTVKWTKQSKANQKKFNGYQIRYSLKSDMSGAKKAYAGKTSASKTVRKLKKNKKYYIQVRTYTKTANGTFYSKWSATKSIKTK